MSVVQTGYVYHLENSFVFSFCLFVVMEGGGGEGYASGGDGGSVSGYGF